MITERQAAIIAVVATVVVLAVMGFVTYRCGLKCCILQGRHQVRRAPPPLKKSVEKPSPKADQEPGNKHHGDDIEKAGHEEIVYYEKEADY